MKLGIFITNRTVDVMIVSKNDCRRSLFCVVYNPMMSRFIGKHIRTMSNRTTLFPEYTIVHKQGDIVFGGGILKKYEEQKNQLIYAADNVNEFRKAAYTLLEEYKSKYSF